MKHQFELGSAQGNTLPDELVDRLLAQLNSKLDGEAIAGAYLGWQQLPGEADEALRSEYKGCWTASTTIWRARLPGLPARWRLCGAPWQRRVRRRFLRHDQRARLVSLAAEEAHHHRHDAGAGACAGAERGGADLRRHGQVCHTVGKCDSDDVAQSKQSGQIYVFFRYLNEPAFFYQNPLAVWSAGLNPDNAAGATLSGPQQQALAEHERALQEYNAFKSKAALVLPDFFDVERTIPKLDYEVVPVSYADAPYGGVAWYQDGNPQTGRKGQFFLNTYYPYGLQSWNISTLLAHEAAPGHHFQITIAQELAARIPTSRSTWRTPPTPPMRRAGRSTPNTWRITTWGSIRGAVSMIQRWGT